MDYTRIGDVVCQLRHRHVAAIARSAGVGIGRAGGHHRRAVPEAPGEGNVDLRKREQRQQNQGEASFKPGRHGPGSYRERVAMDSSTDRSSCRPSFPARRLTCVHSGDARGQEVLRQAARSPGPSRAGLFPSSSPSSNPLRRPSWLRSHRVVHGTGGE